MISQETAGSIWNCYREIAAAERMLKDMETAECEYRTDVRTKTLKDAFGQHRHLQLGVPSGRDCHTLLNVAPELGKSVIRAHIANKQSELAEANERARIELETADPNDHSHPALRAIKE